MSGGWNTIESDAVCGSLMLQPGANAMQGVFTYLIDNLGAKDVQFEELISLDSESLRQQRYVVTGRRTWTSAQAVS